MPWFLSLTTAALPAPLDQAHQDAESEIDSPKYQQAANQCGDGVRKTAMILKITPHCSCESICTHVGTYDPEDTEAGKESPSFEPAMEGEYDQHECTKVDDMDCYKHQNPCSS